MRSKGTTRDAASTGIVNKFTTQCKPAVPKWHADAFSALYNARPARQPRMKSNSVPSETAVASETDRRSHHNFGSGVACENNQIVAVTGDRSGDPGLTIVTVQQPTVVINRPYSTWADAVSI